MRINEASRLVSEKVGDYVSDSFIRFYDKHVLNLSRIKCRRSKYREVTDVDIKKLVKVYALSKIGIPVKIIGDYLKGDRSAFKAIVNRKQELYKVLDGGILDEF